MPSYLKILRVQNINEVGKFAWGYLNDCFRSTVCVEFPP